jgi:hypothetical protein
MSKVLLWFSSVTILITVALLGYIGFYMLYPFKVLDMPTTPVPVMTKEVEAGGQLEYELDYCRYTYKHSHVTKQFIDGVIYTTPSVETINPVGCHKIIVAMKVPDTLDTGVYSLRVLINTEVNKLRTIQNEYSTEQFRIIGKDTIHEQDDASKFEKLLP